MPVHYRTQDDRAKYPLNSMDYGVLPRFMVSADLDFLRLWRESNCLGLGYDQRAAFGDHKNLPALALIFGNFKKGCELFELMRSWGCPSGDGNGIDVSFVEDRGKRSYFIIVAPNQAKMIERCAGPDAEYDYTLMTMTVSAGKDLPISSRSEWLKAAIRYSPILLAPGSMTNVRWELGILKTGVPFLDVSEIKPDSSEACMLAVISGDSASQRPKPLKPPTPAEVSQTRERQLTRFFEITLSRLPFNSTFAASSRSLVDYSTWQLKQAACNLIAAARFPDFAHNGVVDLLEVYAAMRRNPECPADRNALTHAFDSKQLVQQIQNDVDYLCETLFGLQSGDSTERLRAEGYL